MAVLERACKEVAPRSAPIKAASSCRTILTCGPTSAASCWTFRGPARRLNAFIEASHGRFWAECLNAHWFLSLADAQEKVEDWRRYHNEERPHGAIGSRPPILLQNHVGATSPPT
ncbi:transposase [Bradyrhizobium sp. 153]|nr:transposase [Bradyrhizobium sp. 153]